jgi:hypothetical protein
MNTRSCTSSPSYILILSGWRKHEDRFITAAGVLSCTYASEGCILKNAVVEITGLLTKDPYFLSRKQRIPALPQRHLAKTSSCVTSFPLFLVTCIRIIHFKFYHWNYGLMEYMLYSKWVYQLSEEEENCWIHPLVRMVKWRQLLLYVVPYYQFTRHHITGESL